MQETPNWLTIGQAAKYLGISRDTLRRWEKRGKIKAVRSPSNRRYYTQKQLNEVMVGKTPNSEKTTINITRRQGLIIAGLLSFIIAIVAAGLIFLIL